MRRVENVYLKKINNEYYLLPYAQSGIDSDSLVHINETGAFIWRLLGRECSFDYLLEQVHKKYGSNIDISSIISSDITSFLDCLNTHCFLTGYRCTYASSNEKCFLNIAGISITFNGAKSLLSDELKAFSVDNGHLQNPADISIDIVPFSPHPTELGEVIIRNSRVLIIKNKKKYVLVPLTHTSIQEMHISRDYTQITVISSCSNVDAFRQDFFKFLRIPFLLYSSKLNMIALHSASILYNKKVYCFSAPSGTGKSTHVELWHKYIGTSIVNGDLNILRVSANSISVAATPWCGTSGIFSLHEYPLGGIIFLSQSDINYASNMQDCEKYARVISRITTPIWNSSSVIAVSNTVQSICEHTPMYTLACRPDEDAVYVIKSLLDTRLC